MTLIIGAMHDELEVVLSHLKNKEKLNTKTEAYRGFFAAKEVVVAITGVGKVNSSMSLSELLSLYSFEIIVNIGLAGGTSNYEIGDLIFITNAIQYDYDLTHFGYKRGEVPKYVPYQPITKENYLNLKEGLLYTQDKFQSGALDVSKPYLVDMEGAALFMVAKRYNANLVSIKYISDHVESDSQAEQYKQSEKKSGKNIIYEFLEKYLKGR